MKEPAELSDEDREQVERVVAATLDVGHRILDISPPDKLGRVEIRTGWMKGPKFGSGQRFEATKGADGAWTLRSLGGWIS